VADMSDAPFYRLNERRGRYIVDRVEGEELIDGFEPDDDWGRCIVAPELADVASRESAMAVLRLFGATKFQDWTKQRGWDLPFTMIEARGARR